jgi:hypothetical protein
MPAEEKDEDIMLEESGKILEEIGRAICEQFDYHVESFFFMSEVGDNVASGCILEDAGNRLIYHLPADGIIPMAIRLSELLPAEKRWQILRYSVRDEKFSAEFDYPKDIDQEESENDRADRILQAWAGNRSIDYTQALDEFNRFVAGADLYPDG